MKILVLASHPDDEALGCGATAARLALEGHEVHAVILGEGATSREESEPGEHERAKSALLAQSRRAAEVLGLASTRNLGLPDNRFDSVPLLDIVQLVEGVIREIGPELLLTHHGGDLNVDHRLTHAAALTATRPMQGCPVREILAFEVPSSTEWAFDARDAFAPNVFFDVAATIDKKIQAMAVYEEESRPFPHPRSAKSLRALAESRGSIAGLAAAEAFMLVRSVRA